MTRPKPPADAQAAADLRDTSNRQQRRDAARARVAASLRREEAAMDLAAWSWSQPCCLGCWIIRHPGRVPVRLRDPRPGHLCVFCAEPADDGIFVRIDPKHAAHPTLSQDES